MTEATIAAGWARDPLEGQRIVLGVSGSIAAYKALAIASALVQAGASVDAVLTQAAGALVRPLAFRALTHRPTTDDLWDPTGPLGMDHVAMARGADALLIAPATADVIARLALGLASDALTATALAVRAPLVVAPAMEPRMWSHPATQGHVATLVERGAHFVGPMAGRMASGERGLGRMAEPEDVVDHLRLVLAHGALVNRRILVVAGPTHEALDPVRYLSNHSTGRMGIALARLARDRGADVTLVLGPVAHALPAGIAHIDVVTAAEMAEAVLAHAEGADVVIMAAAVADFRPSAASQAKIKKGAAQTRTLELERTDDILMLLDARWPPGPGRPLLVGFAAETDDLVVNARAKLIGKRLDLVVANPVPETFGSASSRATLVAPAGDTPLPLATKREVAAAILAFVADRLAERTAAMAPGGHR